MWSVYAERSATIYGTHVAVHRLLCTGPNQELYQEVEHLGKAVLAGEQRSINLSKDPPNLPVTAGNTTLSSSTVNPPARQNGVHAVCHIGVHPPAARRQHLVALNGAGRVAPIGKGMRGMSSSHGACWLHCSCLTSGSATSFVHATERACMRINCTQIGGSPARP